MAQQAVYNAPPAIVQSSFKTSPFKVDNDDVSKIERKVKKKTNSKSVRVAEYFGDFDPLRSGSITKDQFRRSMDHHLGVSLSDREYDLLTSKYATDPNRVNYKHFVEKLEKELDDQYSGEDSGQSYQRVSEITQFDDKAKRLMQMCARYYKNRGIRVKACYQDFDRHNMGYITFSQFHRSFPGPPEIKDSDISIIAEYYLDPSSGLYDYLKFNSDIEVFWESEARKKKAAAPLGGTQSQREISLSLEALLHCIQNVVYKNGIRTTEFLCDHDKLRTGIITENQFICGLSLCLGQLVHLSRDDIQRIVKHYQMPDGRVCYKDFCDLMENAYTASNLEQNPDEVIYRPLHGQLHRGLNSLDAKSEMQLERVIVKLKTEVGKRRLLLHSFFKDFDRSRGYTRGVTKSQFQRVMDFLKLSVTPEDMKLIVKKFENPVGGDIDYSAFIQAIDGEYVNHVVEVEDNQPESQSSGDIGVQREESSVNLDELMADIQAHVTVNWIRTCEHFQDFDPLRSGSIGSSKFRQGLSSLGFPNLTTAQFKVLCKKYEHPKFPSCIAWKSFVNDVDEAFRDSSAIVTIGPSTSDSPQGNQPLSHSAAMWRNDKVYGVMERLKQKINQRRILLKPCFQDFDRHNMGFITKPQFRQCLSYLELAATEEEMLLMESQYTSDKGFKYLEFLREFQPPIPLERKFDQRLETLVNDKLRLDMTSTESFEKIDLRQLAGVTMNKIRIKVSKERIRVMDFMTDYDKLRSGRILTQSFTRALDLCGFKLNMEETKALVERYKSAKDPNYVEYTRFSDDVECIFTIKELEKMPTVEVGQFNPPEEVDLNQLSPEQERVFMNSIHKLAARVRVRRIQLFPLFEDYDRVNIGSVTKSQFRRVLNELELSGLLSDYEYTVLYKKFGIKVGGRVDVYYLAFCGIVEEYALTQR